MIIEVDVPEYIAITLLDGEFSSLEKEMAIDISIKNRDAQILKANFRLKKET